MDVVSSISHEATEDGTHRKKAYMYGENVFQKCHRQLLKTLLAFDYAGEPENTMAGDGPVQDVMHSMCHRIPLHKQLGDGRVINKVSS